MIFFYSFQVHFLAVIFNTTLFFQLFLSSFKRMLKKKDNCLIIGPLPQSHSLPSVSKARFQQKKPLLIHFDKKGLSTIVQFKKISLTYRVAHT
jgi:hypothetical protein